jgi:hypothetical protein
VLSPVCNTKALIISALIAAALLAGVTGIRRSHSPSTNDATAAMPTIQELQSIARADKLAIEDFDDRSLVYPRETKH